MSFERRTSVYGNRVKGKHVFGWLSGHWKIASAANWARRMGAVGTVCIEHKVVDLSGRGRTGSKGRWQVIVEEVKK